MWSSWIPKPFYWDWLPADWRAQLEAEFDYWTPKYAWVLTTLIITYVPWLYAAAMAWYNALASTWQMYQGPPAPEPPAPPDYQIEYGELPIRPIEPYTTRAQILADWQYMQVYGLDYRDVYYDAPGVHIAEISQLIRYHTRGLWGGPANHIINGTGYIYNGEGWVTGEMDGCLITLTDLPPSSGGLSHDGDVLVVPRLGWLTFGLSGVYDERHKVEMIKGVYVPRNLARADEVRVACKPGTAGVISTWIMGAGEP